jgi:hypothetical protein
MRAMVRCVLLLIAALGPGVALADAFRAPALKPGTHVSVQAYGQQNPACAEWTNGCVVCVGLNGRAQCSTPGIACTPGGLTCKRQVMP